MNAIAAGQESEYGALRLGSEHYRNAAISNKEDPLEKIEYYTNPRIASAIAEGFIKFAIYADIKVSAEDLGRVEATNRSFMQEYVVAAGLHRAISGGREDELSRCASMIGIVALRHSYFSKEEGSPLADWAVRHLSKVLESGITKFYNTGMSP